MSEIRKNYLTGEWVIIAPERARRGGNLAPAPALSTPPDFLATCPFCPGNESLSEERYRINGPDGAWRLRSVVNKFSVLSTEAHSSPAPSGLPFQISLSAAGLHEVLVESPHHSELLALGDHTHILQVLEAYRDRFLAFHQDPNVRHVIVFKNHGAEAGASQQHPHSQIVGLPIVPGQVADRIDRAKRFFDQERRCLACSILHSERAQATRIIAENDDFVAFIPFAALSPYHLWIFPKQHAACFAVSPIPASLAAIVHTILAKLYGMLGDPAFNLVIRSLGPHEADSPHFHWYISIVPRVNKTAGFELGTGMYINPSSPEANAALLREYPISIPDPR